MDGWMDGFIYTSLSLSLSLSVYINKQYIHIYINTHVDNIDAAAQTSEQKASATFPAGSESPPRNQRECLGHHRKGTPRIRNAYDVLNVGY